MSDFFGGLFDIQPKRVIRDGVASIEFSSDPQPLTVDALSDIFADIRGTVPPGPTKLYVRRETVQQLRLMMKRHHGVPVLGKRVRWRRDRWQVVPL